MKSAMANKILIVASLLGQSAAQRPDQLGVDLTPLMGTQMLSAISLLWNMQQQGEAQQEAEKVQYGTYKDWCSKEIRDKRNAVDTSADSITVLKADISSLTARANQLQAEIAKMDADVVKWGQEIEDSKDQRAKDLEVHDKLIKEYTESTEALGKAVESIKAGQMSAKEGAALLEIGSIDTWKADKIAAFLAEASVVEQAPTGKATYDIGTTRVLKMLEKLNQKFGDEKAAAEKDESIAVAAFEKLQADLSDSIKTGEEASKKKIQERAGALQDASDKKAEKEETEATKADDTTYLNEVVTTCKQKASDYEDRTKLRSEELATVKKAIRLLVDDSVVATDDNRARAGLLQTDVIRQKTTLAVMRRFLSISPNQDRAAKFLATKAKELDSTLLSALALQAGQDPMDKVREMVQKLITKLENETGLSKDQQIWCDKELDVNEKARTKQSTAIETTTLGIETTAEEIAKLGDDITELTKQLADNAASLAAQTKQRAAEKATNDLAIKDAKVAQKALTQALASLRDFYERAKGATALLQQASNKQLPTAPAIFDKAYNGNQEKATGVVGLLEEILSDYSSLESTTTANEKAAQDSFDEMTSTGSQLKAQQESDLKHKTARKSQKEEDKANLEKDLSTAKKELAAAMTWYDKLKDSCTAEGSRMKDREARRKAEIASLQDAMKLLNGETPA